MQVLSKAEENIKSPMGLPDDSVVKNPPVNAGDAGFIPGL